MNHSLCLRHYSDPDADWGWEPGWLFFGYTLYPLVCHSPDAQMDLPLSFHFISAGRHDSANFLVAINEFRKNAPDITIRDIRLYPPVPRGTAEWKKIYNNRTASERINNRILNNYKLHSMRIHFKGHYSFMTMTICICTHLDAWYKKAHKADRAA